MQRSPADYSAPRAVLLNFTIKRSPERSHTRSLIDAMDAVVQANCVPVEVIRPFDHEIAYGVCPETAEHG